MGTGRPGTIVPPDSVARIGPLVSDSSSWQVHFSMHQLPSLLFLEVYQTEYGLAWALIAGMLFLGVLVISIPRPRKHDVPENEIKKAREGNASGGTGKSKSSPSARKANSFGAALARRREQK